MGNRTHSETLEQQRRAQKEFLALKRMQNGEQTPQPKPSEIAIVPKTPKEKAANFWFHYKWVVLGLAAVTVAIAVLITQCAGRTSYDMKVVISCYTPLTDAETERIAAYLEPFCQDLNGDGETHLQVINCSYSKSNDNSQYQYTMATRLQAILAADADALLFLTDKDAYDYLNTLADGNLFEAEPYLLGEAFYKACDDDESLVKLPEGLQLSCRNIGGMAIEKNPETKKFYRAAQKILKAVRENEKP